VPRSDADNFPTIVSSSCTHPSIDSLPSWALVADVPVMLQRGVKADLAMVPVTGRSVPEPEG
jgi:hypothetical protein